VQLTIAAQEPTAVAAQQAVAQATTNVVAGLRALNVTDLQTEDISLEPVYDYVNGTAVLRGFAAGNTLSFNVDTTKAGQAIDTAVQLGATSIDRIGFLIDPAAESAAENEALKLATQDALTKGQSILGALGRCQTSIGDVSIPEPPVRPEPLFALAAAAPAEVTTPVIGADRVVTAHVQVGIIHGACSST